MLNLFEKEKVYYDEFSYYFDRNNNINIIFSFNFIQLLKDLYPQAEEKYLYFFKNKYDIKVYLHRKEEFSDFYERIEDVTNIELFPDSKFSTFFCRKNASNFVGKYRILVRVSYSSKWDEYVDIKLASSNTNHSDFNNLKNIKIINEQKYSSFEMKSNIFHNQYEFFSRDIIFEQNKYFISNLYEIYNRNISYSSLDSFLSQTKNRTLNTNYYIDSNIPYKLNFDINNKRKELINYNKLIMKIFSGSNEFNNYRELQNVQNIFFISEQDRQSRYENRTAQKSYEKLANSLSTAACENDLFSDMPHMSLSTAKQNDFNLTLLAFYLNTVSNLENNEYWTEDISLLPVYILDVLTKYTIYYLSNIDEESMSQTWAILDENKMNELSSGNYLCKITTTQEFLFDSLLENYFILNK